MTDIWRPRLSEHLDGDLTAEETIALRAHLRTCPDCREAIESLRRVMARIDEAPDREPERDLWPELAQRMESDDAPAAGTMPPVLTPGVWRLAAALAAVGVMALSAWMWRSQMPGDEGTAVGVPVMTVSSDSVDRYGEAAAAWQELMAGRQLPAELTEALAAEMAAFERAVGETRAALAEDPTDAELRAHLAGTLRAQVRFLSRVEEMVGETS